MLTTTKANEFARTWIDAWNSRDIRCILPHYSDDIIFSSPFVEEIAGSIDGSVQGRDELGKYFEIALKKFPSLHFDLRAVMLGMDTVTLLYESVRGLLAGETMVLNAAGQITRVWVHYDRIEDATSVGCRWARLML
jgi:hypothetical protein